MNNAIELYDIENQISVINPSFYGENNEIYATNCSTETNLNDRSSNSLTVTSDICEKKHLLSNYYITDNKIDFYFFKLDKYNCLNKFLSMFFHISIMVSFEIFFYFYYIVNIERLEILKKIFRYMRTINSYELTYEQQFILHTFLNSSDFENFYNNLYIDYTNSIEVRNQALKGLIKKSCLIGSGFYFTFFLLLTYGIYKYRRISWKWLLSENFYMLLFLGIFEYFFFVEIIMNYDPLTNAEIQYYFIRNIYEKYK